MKKISAFLIFLLCGGLSAREYRTSDLQDEVEFLCCPRLEGRATGTDGGAGAALYIYQAFRSAGLDAAVQPLAGGGINIIGAVPGRPGARTVIVMAYYDGLGKSPSGELRPGADSNSSGVVGLLELARAFAEAPRTDYNYLFVALDGHNSALSGASALASAIRDSRSSASETAPGVRGLRFAVRVGTTTYAGHEYSVRPAGSAIAGRPPYSGKDIFSDVSPRTVAMVVNLDTIGSSLSPGQDGRRDYLLALGAGRWARGLEECNRGGANLRLYYDYYGSASFTRMFFRMRSDQKPLLDMGLPCVMFTSGITFNTNHPSDTPSTLDYQVLRRRLDLIERWLRRL